MTFDIRKLAVVKLFPLWDNKMYFLDDEITRIILFIISHVKTGLPVMQTIHEYTNIHNKVPIGTIYA